VLVTVKQLRLLCKASRINKNSFANRMQSTLRADGADAMMSSSTTQSFWDWLCTWQLPQFGKHFIKGVPEVENPTHNT